MSERQPFVFRMNDHYGQGPELVRQVFLERGWQEYDELEQPMCDWNLWWRCSQFRVSEYDNIKRWQWLNHCPKSMLITRKDSLGRNLSRMKAVYGPAVFNFSPVSFNLPNDYTKFVADYTRLKEKHPDKTFYWICKPVDLSRGRGIFIFRDLSELQYDCSAVIQQYITNPLLISGYKFDLRLYVLIPSFHPLTIYVYQEGLARFSTQKYDLDCLDNNYAHLTNTSINKHSPTYTEEKERVGAGCKWTLMQLRHYFHQVGIDDTIIWARIINIIILTVALQAHQVRMVDHTFELYGFDIIIDENLKPWLLEVNLDFVSQNVISPSFSLHLSPSSLNLYPSFSLHLFPSFSHHLSLFTCFHPFLSICLPRFLSTCLPPSHPTCLPHSHPTYLPHS